MKKFRFADLFNQLYGFPSHLRGAFFPIVQLFVCSNTFEDTHELANHDREILVLRYLEQLSNSEIADVLGLSDVAVRSRHMRALDRLTRLIDREGL